MKLFSCLVYFSEAVIQRCSVKKVFLNFSKIHSKTGEFSGKLCQIFKNTFFHRASSVAASEFCIYETIFLLRDNIFVLFAHHLVCKGCKFLSVFGESVIFGHRWNIDYYELATCTRKLKVSGSSPAATYVQRWALCSNHPANV